MTPTPRTDAVIYAPGGNYFSESAADFRRLARQLETELNVEKAMRNHLIQKGAKLETELTEAREQLEHALNPVHSCGVGCQREACVMRRELEGKLNTARADAFEEASDLAFDMGEPSTACALKNKAAAIRKGNDEH